MRSEAAATADSSPTVADRAGLVRRAAAMAHAWSRLGPPTEILPLPGTTRRFRASFLTAYATQTGERLVEVNAQVQRDREVGAGAALDADGSA